MFIALDQRGESSWLPCLLNCGVTEQWSHSLTPRSPPTSSLSHQTLQGVKEDEVRQGHVSQGLYLDWRV